MNYDIKRGSTTIATVRPEGGLLRQRIMGENVVQMSFTLAEAVDFTIGDTVLVYGETYYLNQMPAVQKVSSLEYRYTATFESVAYELGKIQFFFLDALNALKEADFSLMGNLQDFLNLIVANANRVSSGWSAGEVVNSEYKNLTFSGENCLAALARLASEFNTEFWFDGKSINLSKKEQTNPLTFSYGQGNGLYEISRTTKDSTNIITRLYAFGSSTNLPGDYRNYAKRLRMTAGALYVEQNTSQYGTIEATQLFEDVYPQRVGTVSAVNGSSIYKFSDAAIDFDVNAQLLPGITAKLTFNTGQLAGYEFEIASFNNTTKEFTIIQNKDEKALELPSTLLKPAIGDKYVLTDIKMPQSYIDAAEAELVTKANEYLSQNSSPRVSYSVVLDPIHAQANSISLNVGDNVTIVDAPLGINKLIRIVALNRSLTNGFDYQIELAEVVQPTILNRVLAAQEQAKRVIDLNSLSNVNRARRSWRTTQELQGMVFDTDGYFTDKIRPLSIETSLLSVGAKSGNFLLKGVLFAPNYQGNVSQLSAGGGVLEHYAIADSIKTWNFSGQTFAGLVNGTAYYVYARCNKTTTAATFVLSASQITVEQDTGYYHFLIGILHSVVNNYREISLLYGSTLISGKSITTGKISSADGLTWFDLDTGEISGKITFGNNSSGYNNLTDKPDLSVYATNGFVNSIKNDLQSQIDGNVTTWFYGYVPTLGNVPASDWATNAVKDQHLGDLFYDTNTGYAYRFQVVTGVYSWQKISDADITAALANAQQAQDTADGKRRVFATTPVVPYDVGDLWVQGTSGDIMRCQTAKTAVQSYNSADWVKASKYTDDTTANTALTNAATAQTAANNAQASANTANSLLADLSNDNLLTPIEKSEMAKEWGVIVGEKPIIESQAGTYGVSSSDYTTAYGSLESYLVPYFADLNANSVIVGSTFRANFKAYYDAKVALLKLVSDAAKAYANTAVNNLKVGGRNLAIGSSNGNGWSGFTSRTGNEFSKTIAISGEDFIFSPSFQYVAGKEMVVSFEAKSSSNVNSTELIILSGNYPTEGFVMYTGYTAGVGVWNKIVIKFTVPASIVTSAQMRFDHNGSTDGLNATLQIRNIKLEYGNKDTDWTPAPEDVQAGINTAQTAANDAQTSANTANSLLADLSNDNMLTPIEKSEMAKEWGVIVGEKPIIESQAGTYGVSSSDYTTAYGSLESYLVPYFADLNANSVIVGSTFRAKFKAYYDAKTELLKNVSDAAKAAVDNVRVGSRNYVLKSRVKDAIRGYRGDATSTLVSDAKFGTVVEYSRPSGVGEFQYEFNVSDLLINSEVVFMVIAKRIGTGGYFAFGGWDNTFYRLDDSSPAIDLGDGWKMYWNTFSTDASGIVRFITFGINSVSGTWQFHAVGVFKGNKPTDWTPAPEDVNQQIADSTKTTIDGGMVTTGTIKLGNDAGVNAGITGNGGGSSDVRFWAGDTYANRAIAPFVVTNDGQVVMTKATLKSAATGKRIVIDSTNNTLSFYDSSGAKRINFDDNIDFYDGSTGYGADIGGVSIGERGLHLNDKRILGTAFSKVNTFGNYQATKHQTIINVRNGSNNVYIMLPDDAPIGKVYFICRYNGKIDGSSAISQSSGTITIQDSYGQAITTISGAERSKILTVDDFYSGYLDWIVL
ncbi:phage tail protein [Solitalea koreensis]|uniref:Prophage endopeptidase tail n=1 Tax=Solitalea koreensis TaxID=543615 RepID=A0A521BLU2_9SPHI|nr:phage tail protein [Solitalea koreensis]SMO48062.1 Prophage endopeptidase tail [Solitalea koreensis]